MMGDTQEKVFLEFREDSVSNVIYEESSKFGNSISSPAYFKAFQITQVILSVNNNYQAKKRKSGTTLRNQEQFFNIIVFSGGRGTGKTSVMLSYMEFLKDYYRNLHSGKADEQLGRLRFMDHDQNMELMFTGLEYIDASLLGSRKDDVLRNVLPKMLKKWHDEEQRSNMDSGIVRDEDYAYKKRQIHRLFNNVYKSLRDLNSKEDILEADNDLFMETLENLSLTWNLRQSFQELVKAYLDIMEYPGSEEKIGRHNHFLVISLDDLDMNIEHGFDLLEEIRKYLMVPNVIVLLSANYEQLLKLCVNHYTKTFKETKEEAETKEYISKLSREYLEKILPAHCQVVMKPVDEWKFYDQEKIGMTYTKVNDKKFKTEPETLKEIIRHQLEDFFDMKFSPDGQCLRYLMPSTIRELALWIRQLYSLNPLEFHLDNFRNEIRSESDAEYAEAKRSEHKMNLLFFWREKLLPLNEKFSSRSLYIIDQLDPEGQILTLKDIQKEDEENLSLLELLGKRIRQTREAQEDTVLSIIYLTVKFTDLFFAWYSMEDDILSTYALDNIKRYFQNGIWGEWEKKMICQGVKAESSELYDISRIRFRKMQHCLDCSLSGKFTNNDKEKEKFILNNQQTLINYQLRLVFFDFQTDFTFSGMKLGEEEGNYRIELKEDKYTGCFALSNVMRPWEDKERILTDFLMSLLNAFGTDEKQTLGKKIINMIDIRNKNNNYIILPVENVEYLIHVGQTLEDKFRGSRIDMESSLILDKIKDFFDVIRSSLEDYDSTYHTIYLERFEKTQIGIELRQEDSKQGKIADAGLLNMLADSICRVAVPHLEGIID